METAVIPFMFTNDEEKETQKYFKWVFNGDRVLKLQRFMTGKGSNSTGGSLHRILI